MKKYIFPIILIILVFVGIVCLMRLGPTPNEQPSPPTEILEPEPQTATPTILSEGTYTWDTNIAYETAIHALGYEELCSDYSRPTPWCPYPCEMQKLTVTEEGFCLNFAYQTLFLTKEINETTDAIDLELISELELVDGWALYGQKSDKITNIISLSDKEYGEVQNTNEDNIDTSFRQQRTYVFTNSQNEQNNITICYAIYYPRTKNLYNFVKTFDSSENVPQPPAILWEKEEDLISHKLQNSTFYLHDDYPIEMAEFQIKTGNTIKTYQYRVGMTLEAWAASELACGEWMNMAESQVLSADTKYILSLGDKNINKLLDETKTLVAQPAKEVHPNLEEYINLFVKPAMTPTTMTHIVDWQSPLCITGVKIDSLYAVSNRYTLHHQAYIYDTSETITISLNNIDEALVNDMNLYVFKEPTEFLLDMEKQGGFFQYINSLSNKTELITIPKDARAIPFTITENTFEIVENEQVLSAERIASATFTINAEPNYDPYNPNVFAITYKDNIVCWIHVPIWSSNTNIIDFSQITVVLDEDGNFELKSEYYSEDELIQIQEMIKNDPQMYEELLKQLSHTEGLEDSDTHVH